MNHSLVRNTLIAGVAALAIAPVGSSAQEPEALSRTQLDGIELEYAVSGNPNGEAVLLIHAGVFHGWWGPLLGEPALEGYRLIRYNRVGYGGSSRPTGPVSNADGAAHARALMRYLGIGRAHVVGHSSSADIALQLALDDPDAVVSLTLLEPGRPDTPAISALRGPGVGMALELFHAGNRAEAVDTFLRTVAGPDYRAVIDNVLPDAIAQAEADAETFFGTELPALSQWSFTEDDARRVRQPVLQVVGAETQAIFAARHELLLGWLPNAEPYVLPEATHLLYLQNPRPLADAMAGFFTRHAVGQVESAH